MRSPSTRPRASASTRSSRSATKADGRPRMATATLLLPPRRRIGGEALPDWLARVLGRADTVPAGEEGERAQMLRHFDLLPRGWPVAALTRSRDADDADTAQWMRADPAWIRPDINGAR